MRFRRAILPAAFVILLSSFLFAQEEKAGFFSLNSSRTYAPGQKVSIDMWAQNVETLEFRVYRVNDPVKFFVDLGIRLHRANDVELPAQHHRRRRH